MENNIEGKVVVITGANSGIGEATALLLAERGAKVVLGARGLDRLKALAARIAGAGGEAAYARTDVKRREDLTALVKLACERYGKLGPFLFGSFGAADAMFAPVVHRFRSYAIPVDPEVQVYMETMMALPAFREWTRAGLAETLIVEKFEEA